MSSKIYMIVLMDSASDNYTYGVFKESDSPMKAFTSLDDAKAALESHSEKYSKFFPTAYGKAFPYDSVSFEEELEKSSFAPWGWATEETEDGPYRICLGLILVSLQ
jgi:hypothetical protein